MVTVSRMGRMAFVRMVLTTNEPKIGVGFNEKKGWASSTASLDSRQERRLYRLNSGKIIDVMVSRSHLDWMIAGADGLDWVTTNAAESKLV